MKSKIFLIIKREYLTRVRNKTFLISTFLLPLVLIGFFAATIYLTIHSGTKQKIAVNDQSGTFHSAFVSDDEITFDFPGDVNADNFEEKGYSAFLNIPRNYESANDSVSLISMKQLSVITEEKIKDNINEALRNKALLELNIDKNIIDSINNLSGSKLYKFSPVVRQGEGTKASNAGLAYGIGFGSGMLIYLTLFIYGAAVMRGVMEEKTNRIAEVIISSVRPFQLMLGKIIGIAGVGITQLMIWLVLIIILTVGIGAFLSPDLLNQSQEIQQAMAAGNINSPAMEVLNARDTFVSANWALILPVLIFYFLAGYLFYASLFAAVGSVVNEDPQEAQSLMLPIMMPIILSFLIMMIAVNDPDSSLAFWGSIIPFSSPIVMMARIPTGDVSAWELLLSMALLVGGFIFTTYLAARIYRTGILLYGKKVTLKELGKWAFRRS